MRDIAGTKVTVEIIENSLIEASNEEISANAN